MLLSGYMGGLLGHRLAGGGGVDGDVAVIKHKYSYNSICRLKSQYTTLKSRRYCCGATAACTRQDSETGVRAHINEFHLAAICFGKLGGEGANAVPQLLQLLKAKPSQ